MKFPQPDQVDESAPQDQAPAQSPSGLKQWSGPEYAATATNPAAPEGLRQTAAEAAASPDGLRPWFGPSYVGAAQDWYGGRNVEGTNNGWSTDFMARAFDYNDQIEARSGATMNPTISWNMFDTSAEGNSAATGVATWNDPQNRWKRGDVFDNGVRVRNLYDDMDEASADLMLAEFLFTGDEKRDIFSDSDRTARLHREVMQRTDEMSETAANAATAYDFTLDVDERQADIEASSVTDPAIAAAGAAGGAALGAGVGAFFGGVGAVPGAIVGGILGGVGAYLNQDQVVEQLARASEITDRALQKYDPIRASLTSATEWGGLVMKSISPFSNVWQGSYDALSTGGLGDGKSEFYEVNEWGERKAPAWMQVGDIAMVALDSIAQFASPVGRTMYMYTMGGMGGGQLLGNLSTQAVFNMRTGTFDELETGTEWIGAIGSPLIDVAQMGMARAVSRAAVRFSKEANAFSDTAKTTYEIERGGMRFTRDKATGEITKYRTWTLGALAPSENIWQVPIRWKARTIALKSGRTEVTGDDLFRAAQTITAPASPWRGALVNGLAEGYEEAWQGILDPMAVSEQIDGRAVFIQAMYGAAGGVGMSAGAMMQRTDQGLASYKNMSMRQVELEARLKHAWRSDYVMTDEEWAAFRGNLSDDDLRRMAVSDGKEAQEIGGVVRAISEQLTIDNTRTSVLGDAFARAVTKLRDSGLKKINPNAEEGLVVLAFENTQFVTSRGMEEVERPNAAMMSSREVMLTLGKRVEAFQAQLEQATDAAQLTEIQGRLDAAIRLHAEITQMQEQMRRTTSLDEVKLLVSDMNTILRNAYDGRYMARSVDANGATVMTLLPPEQQAWMRKAATLVLGRHPFLDTGSFAGFMPQVSYAMTLDNTHAAVGVHQAMLKPMQADHDGDRMTTINLAYLPDDTIESLRRGLEQFVPVAKPVIGADGKPQLDAEGKPVMAGSVLTHAIDMPDGENTRMLVWTEELGKPTHTSEYQAVEGALSDVETWVIATFADHSPAQVLTATGQVVYVPGTANPQGPLSWDTAVRIAAEFRRAFEAGDANSVQTLRDALLNEVGAAGISEMSDRQPVLLELQQFFTTRFMAAGAELARLRMTRPATATVLIDQQRPDDVINQKAISRGQASTVSATLGQMGNNDPTRDAQMLWYSSITKALADVRDNDWTPVTTEVLARLFVEDTDGDYRSELEQMMDKGPVQGRVMAWLDAMVKDIDGKSPAFKGKSTNELRIILAMMEVPAVERVDGPNWRGQTNGGRISLLQYLLRKSINVEEDALRNVPEEDPRWAKLNTLRSLTYDNGPHSYTPKTALIEMVKWLPAESVVGRGDADYLGHNTTLNQLIKEMAGLHPSMRKERLHRLKRSPAYMQEEHRGLGDPPYNLFRGAENSILNDKGELRVNAYTLTVDALETAVNKLPDQYEARDKKAGEDFRTGWDYLQNTIAEFHALLQSEGDTRDYSDADLLETLISRNPQLADLIVSLIPEASLSGTFLVQENRVYAAPWLMKVLTAENAKIAEKDYFIYKHLTEFNYRGANVDMSKLPDNLTDEQQQEWIQANATAIEYNQLQSRFQQTLHIAATDPTGFLLGWLLQKAKASESLEELLDAINEVPKLLNNRAPLLGYLDDVATFESRPEDIWSAGLSSTKLLENLSKWSSRVKQMSDAALKVWTMEASDKVLLKDAENFLTSGKDVRKGSETVALIQQARRNRQRHPDAVGPTARNEFLRACWDPFVHMEDKGAAPAVARFLESILTSFSFGLRQGWEQAIDGVTAYQWSDIATNVTKLLDGPVQIMLPDGRSMLLDMSKDLTVVQMLQDPTTRAFAKAVLFDTVRDVDQLNSIQHYADTASDGSIGDLLFEQNSISLLTMDQQNPRARLLNAHRGIGLVESALIKGAMVGTEADQGAALLPITRTLGELFVAYTSRADLDGVNKQRMQDEAVADMWAVLVGLASKKKYDREIIRDTVMMELRARQGGTGMLAEMQEFVNSNPLMKEAFENVKVDMVIQLIEQGEVFLEEARAFEALITALPDPAQRTPDEQDQADSYKRRADQLRQQATDLETQAEGLQAGNLALFDTSLFDADVIKSMYIMQDENEPGIDSAEQARRIAHNESTRLNIRNLLETGNNKEAFRGKGVSLDLLNKLAEVTNDKLADLNNPKKFDAADWEQLGYWAATVHFTEQTERSAEQALRSMGKPEVDRVYDRTYSYLVDVMFDEAVLDEIASLINPMLAAFPTVELDDISAMITGKLLAQDRLGKWTSSIVPETLKIQEMIKRGPIGLAVAAAGNHAKEQRSQWGTATATTTKPLDEHLSTLILDPQNPDQDAWRKIANGFYTELTVTVNGQTRDIAKLVGTLSARDGMDPRYMILRRKNWDEAIAKLEAEGFIQPGVPVEVSITFVDPDKKPYTAQYINSVYFDKAGRNEEFSPANDVISASLSSQGGWVKDSSQRVLDTAARGGSPGFPTPSIPQTELAKLRRDPAQAGDFIRRAAQLILDKQYNDMNDMLDVDQAAVIKLLKQRFVVVGKINGEQSIHWIDEVIAMQGQLPFDAGTAMIVELSQQVASTLLSEQGMVIKPGLVTNVAVNPSMMAVPGALNTDRLEALALTGLGDSIEWNDANSPIRSFSPLRASSMSENRGDPYMRTYRERMKRWNIQASMVHDTYHAADQAEWDKRNEQRRRDVEVMLGNDLLLNTFNRLGMSSDVVNSDSAASDLKARAQVQKFLGDEVSGWRFFRYSTKTGDKNVGIISLAETYNDFENAGKRPPVYGDAVAIDLDEFVPGPMTQDDWDRAARQVMEVMEAFGHRGVRIFLQSTTTSYHLKERIATWMMSNPMGYEPVHNSTSLYVPTIESGYESKTARALRQSLTETEVWHPKDVMGRILSDEIFPQLGANENTVFIDTSYNGITPWTRMAQLLVPGDLTIANEQGAISLNYPTDAQMALLQRYLLPILENDETWQTLREAHGADPNPNIVATYSREQFAGGRDLLEPGILELEAARQRLIDMLKRGKMPTINDEILPGEFLPVINVARDGAQTVVLTRTGFTMPDESSMRQQWNTQFDPNNPMKVAISTNEINDAQTVPPPMILTEEPQNYGNGLMMIGQFEHHTWGKWVDAFFSFKAGRVRLTALEFMGPMGNQVDVGWRPNELGSLTSESGKLTMGRVVNNFRDLFSVTGFDIRNLMVDALVGKQASQDEYDKMWTALQAQLERWSRKDHGFSEDQLYKIMTFDSGLSTAWQEFNSFITLEGGVALSNPSPEMILDDPTTRIATLAIMSLMAPRIHTEHLFSRPGMMTIANIKSDTLQVVTLPPLFTKALQNPNTPKTVKYLIDMANQNMPSNADGLLYEFDTNFKLHTQMRKADGTVIDVVGWLQLVKPTPATEDLNAYADANTKAERDESLHIAGVLNSALGAETTLQKDFEKKLKPFTNGDAIVRFGNTSGRGVQGNLWQMLTRVKAPEDRPHQLMPLQWKYVSDGIDDMRSYCKAFDKSGWDADIARVREEQAKLLKVLGLTRNLENQRIEVDYLVRQFYGSPGQRKGQENFTEVVSATDYIEAVRQMIWFAEQGRNPLEAAKVPFPHETLWRKIFEAGTWRPVLGRGDRTRVAADWEQAVYALFGQIEQSQQTVDTRFRRPMDAFMRTYTDTIPALSSVAVSGDEQLNARLMDPDVNKHFISMDPGVSALLENPVILAEMTKSISNLLGLTQDADVIELGSMDSSALIAHRERVDRWAKRQKMAPQVKTSYMEYLESGTEYIGRAGHTHAFMSGMVNLALINRLFNPALFVSAVFEVVARTSLETFTDLVLGDQVRAGGILANKASRGLERATRRLGAKDEEGNREGINWSPRYDDNDIKLLRSLSRELATSTDFMEYLYKELMFTHLVTPGRGRIGNALESGATKTARAFSDPRWGMPSQSVTQLYLVAALEHMVGSGALVDVPSFVQQLRQDPLFLVKNSREEGGFSAHKAGVNRVAQVRALKPTVLGKMITSPIDTMTHGSMGYNFMGHMLKIPFQFASFTANAIITLTGLGGVDQIIAMVADGRQKPGFINRMDAHIRGEKPLKETFDMSDVLEGIDLSRAFIRGGITQTGLFTAALLAGGLGLGGEDDEMRKRRKLAEYLNTPLYLDPREMQNDFLLSDAIFLDSIPILNTIFKDDDMPEGQERSVVVPHWIIRQFTSPMMGTMRFMQTGDVSDIRDGFADAFSVLPYSISNLWEEANMTADLIFSQAKQEDYDGNSATAQASVTELLINGFSIYEKALLENSFINSVRNGSDQFNRNPWVVPATDETGNIIMREGTNNMPMASQALAGYVDPATGLAAQGYDKREGLSGVAHGYAENNLTFSLLASLATGQVSSGSTFLRNNMVVGETTIDLPKIDDTKAEALFFSTYMNQGGQELMSFDEAVRKVKSRYEAAGVRWDQGKVEEEAQIMVDNFTKNGLFGGMSVLDKDGREMITKAGAESVFRSIGKGMLDGQEGSIPGIWVDFPTRKLIEEEWAEDLIQEGVNLGLSQQSAEYRMRRIMRGDDTDPSRPGLRDVLYSDKIIPYSGKARYNQLNMTYMIGPDGKPWATPFGRQNVAQALGIPLPTVPVPAGPGMRKDERGKLVDEVYGINLGVNGLQRQLEEPVEMPDESALDKAAAKTYTPQKSNSYTPFKRFGRGGYGGGGSSFGPYFSNMQNLPENRVAPRPDDVPFINTNTPFIRRARINTERITADRGRLKQWQ